MMIPDVPMQQIEFLDVFITTLLVYVIGTLILNYRKEYGSLRASISQTVAATKRSSMFFALTMLVAYPLYYAWLWLWVGPLLGMPSMYYVLLAVSAIAELVFVLVPASSGWRLRTHQIAAGFVGLVMAILPGMMLFAGQGISGAGRLALVAFYIVLIALVVLLCTPKYRRNTFLYEVIYAAVFIGSVSVVVHT